MSFSTHKQINPSDKFIFNVNDFKIIQNINKGGFGVINLVKNIKDGTEYAAKTNLIPNKTQNKIFISREVRILIQIQHPTIVPFHGFSYIDFNKDKNITILMDYMKEGSLADLISKEEKSLCPHGYDNTKRQIILIGIARGMMLLHMLHVIHRDLKPENILLDIDFYPHITDFGLSKFFDPSHSMSQSMSDIGTAAYMAPEVIDGDHFNTKADVFAFGILMYEVITGKRAYSELFKGKKKLNIFQLKQKVLAGFRPKIAEGMMKKGLKIMIEKCWDQDPKKWPTFSELFRKLSLSNDDFYLEFDDGLKPVIQFDDEEEDESVDDINKSFCLDDVDFDEIFNYVDLINQEPKSKFQQEKDAVDKNKDKEIDNLKEEIDQLKIKVKNQESTISSLNSKLADQSAKISSLESQLEQHLKAQNPEIKSQKIIHTPEMKRERRIHTPELNDDSSSINIPFISDKNLDGVFSFFRKNSSIEDEIKVNDSSRNHGKIEHLTNIKNSCFSYCESDYPDAWFCFEFIKRKIIPSNYTIISTNTSKGKDHLKNWVLEGSLDNDQWEKLDEQVNCPFLNGQAVCHIFPVSIKNKNGFKFLRIRQTGKNWNNNYYLEICSIEFYGHLI